MTDTQNIQAEADALTAVRSGRFVCAACGTNDRANLLPIWDHLGQLGALCRQCSTPAEPQPVVVSSTVPAALDLPWRDLAAEYSTELDRVRAGGTISSQQLYDADRLRAYVHSCTTILETGDIVSRPTPDRHFTYRWRPVDDAEPFDSFTAMREAARWAGPLPVSRLFCDHPVWSVDDNVRFRAWHDHTHLHQGLGFSAAEEVELFAREARRIVTSAGMSIPDGTAAVRALFSESVYQLAYAVVHDGFPDVQAVAPLGPVGRQVLRDLLDR